MATGFLPFFAHPVIRNVLSPDATVNIKWEPA